MDRLIKSIDDLITEVDANITRVRTELDIFKIENNSRVLGEVRKYEDIVIPDPGDDCPIPFMKRMDNIDIVIPGLNAKTKKMNMEEK